MTYKKILTEEIVQQFRKEGATLIAMTLTQEGRTIRTVYVDLADPEQVFCIAGRTPEAVQKLQEYFNGAMVNGRMWHPFRYFEAFRAISGAIETRMKEIAEYVDVPVAYLEYAYFKEEEVKI